MGNKSKTDGQKSLPKWTPGVGRESQRHELKSPRWRGLQPPKATKGAQMFWPSNERGTYRRGMRP